MTAFTYHLHDDYSSAERRAILEGQGVVLSEAAWENMGRPFREVALECEVDERGVVTIRGVRNNDDREASR